jgi:aminoglycoside 3-N-acetyltransferase
VHELWSWKGSHELREPSDNRHMRCDVWANTRRSLTLDLGNLGVRPGDCLLVHGSMGSMGRVVGGPTAVVLAILDAVRPGGTIVVPTQTTGNRDPSMDRDSKILPRYWQYVREHRRPFDPATTPSSGMGVIAERLRRWPGAVRSSHPQTSFAAVGRSAEWLMRHHALDSELGEASPLARLEACGGHALLVGVGYEKCTSFHLAEYRLPNPTRYQQRCLVVGTAGPEWVTYRATRLDSSDFQQLGAAFEDSTNTSVVVGHVANAIARLVSIPDAVAFAKGWLAQQRSRMAD